MSRKLDKFLLLMWKNWLLQYRKPLQTLVEIIAPVLFSILLVAIRSLVDPDENDAVNYTPFQVLPTLNFSGFPRLSNNSSFIRTSLVYSPRNQALDSAMSLLKSVITVKGYNNSKELEAHFMGNEGPTTFAGIQFDDSLFGKDTLPKDVAVSIRFPGELRLITNLLHPNTWDTNLLYPVYQQPDTSSPNNNTGSTEPGNRRRSNVAVPELFNKLFSTRNWKTNLLYPVYQSPGPRDPESVIGGRPGYYAEAFLQLQTVVTALVGIAQKNLTNLDDIVIAYRTWAPPKFQMRRFPYSKWIQDPLLQALETFVGIIIMLSFVYTCINTVKVITTEKEKQLKETMKIMGLPNWLHWTAWFLKTFMFLLISIILIIILLKVSWYSHTNFSVFTYANPSVMLAFLLLYMCATITFCFAISVFFSKANTAATVAGLLWFLSYAPYLFLQQQYDQLSLSTKLSSSLASNTAMAFGFQLMLMFEGTGEGIQWNNVFKPTTPDDTLTLGLIMTMLIIDTIIYLVVALYVEAIFPGAYGVPLPWYFPFSTSFWCGKSTTVGVEDYANIPSNTGEFFEKDPENLRAGIQMRNLCKLFGQKAVVRNLSLNMYDNQITVLLGHNGAGKTTTMSMLTGMFPPTSGTAVVSGHDIRTDMDGSRASLGLCPQHNVLFDDMTVKEHLYLFSRLKGLDKLETDAEIHRYINLLELVPKADAKSATLSGGMKRKLCVGMALCGKSKVVMLDEPTAGMDPSARRALWDLLQEQKKGRTMLLSTHFMDEADLLGDRIAIMAGGKLQCCGSSFFLKKKYGTGYHLIMDKSIDCEPQKVTALLRKHIPNIEIHGNIGSELTYLLPESQASVFQEMLRDLEQNSVGLGIRSYGISLTTLEEVFMKVGADHGQEEAYNTNGELAQGHGNKEFLVNGHANTRLAIGNGFLLTGFKLIQNQYVAMFMKKSLSVIRSWILQILQICMPVAFLIIAIVVSRNANQIGDLPKLPITLNSYQKTVTLIETKPADRFKNIYLKLLGNHERKITDNITRDMLDLTERVPITARLSYLIGASFTEEAITAWFNNNPYHTPPLALGLVLNTLLKDFLDESYNIRFSNEPLPFTADTKVNQLLQGNSMGFQLAFNIGFSMAFVSSFYVLFYVRERVCKSKHLQFVSGVKVYIFWTTAFITDLLTFMVTTIAVLATLLCFQEDGYKTASDLGRMLLLFLYFGVGMIPMMYISSYLFDVPSTGYTRMTLFSVFTGVAAFLVIQVLGTPGLDLEYLSNALDWVFLFIPHYSLATGIRDTYMSFATNKMCKFLVETCVTTLGESVDKCWDETCHNSNAGVIPGYCCVREPNYFKWQSPGIGRNLLFSLLLGFILFVLLILIEYKVLAKIRQKLQKKYSSHVLEPQASEDSDVTDEKNMIRTTPQERLFDDYTLILKNVTKYYKKFIAVSELCLGVKAYECFGLLGVNGAGKTSTFKMMTGDLKMSLGEAWVQGHSINHQLKEVQKLIGYCPQFDALLDDLTAHETLTMFALLRGVPFRECSDIAQKLAKDFDFSRHLHKQVKKFSGGNKRKLSTAISLIGDPPVIFLDEPTTGMDPATKRYLWDAICKVRDQGKCVVLTSHSMEECEALCTRLAIMVRGNFKCLGSTQHLKNKFAAGYTLTIKIKKREGGSSTQDIERFVKQKFPQAQEREKHQELLTYYIVENNVSWSKMFGILEQGKAELGIEDYSLGQSSLEQVFLAFTRSQN